MENPLAHPIACSLAAALFATLACSGGSADAAGSAASGPSATSGAFARTAYLKTRNTVLYNGKNSGLARDTFQAQVDQCNSLRSTHYGLAPVSPPEATLASLDVSVHEKFFDTDKALTLITRTRVELVDMQRWLKDATAGVASGAYPAVPMNCAEVRVRESKSGTLWRDGIKYELRFDSLRAIGSKPANVKVPLASADQFGALPAQNFIGQTCREVTAPAGTPTDSKSCIWDAFPYVAYLNLPFALSGRLQFGVGTALVETIVPVEAQRDRSIAASVFDIPTGFTVTLLN